MSCDGTLAALQSCHAPTFTSYHVARRRAQPGPRSRHGGRRGGAAAAAQRDARRRACVARGCTRRAACGVGRRARRRRRPTAERRARVPRRPADHLQPFRGALRVRRAGAAEWVISVPEGEFGREPRAAVERAIAPRQRLPQMRAAMEGASRELLYDDGSAGGAGGTSRAADNLLTGGERSAASFTRVHSVTG